MVSCFYCKHSFYSLNTLMLHITLKHKTCIYSQVDCNFANCFKKYANVYSLKRHLIRDHQIEKISVSNNNSHNNDNENASTSVNNTTELHEMTNDEIEKLIKNTDILNNSLLPLNFVEINDNNNENISLNTFQDKVINTSLYFITYLYAYGNLSRKTIHSIINEMTNSYLSNLLTIISHRFNNNTDLKSMLNILKNGFKMFKTEHITFAYLKNINCLFLPSKIIIRSYLTSGRSKKRVRTVLRNSTLSIVPLKQVLIKFLELPNVYSSILSHSQNDRSLYNIF